MQSQNPSPVFDPFAYAADIKAHPENYVRVSDVFALAIALHKIKHAATMEALKERFEEAKKVALGADDRKLINAAKDKRKANLSEKVSA